MSNPQKGEVWYVSIGGASVLTLQVIDKITDNIVELRNYKEGYSIFGRSTVYKISHVEFVERLTSIAAISETLGEFEKVNDENPKTSPDG